MKSNSRVLLRSAVENNTESKKNLLLQKLFTYWFHGFIYNQIWEDPRVDAEALQLNNESRIVTIGSGGCNVLNYLTHAPEKISVVDINPFHMNLVRLKLCAVKTLPDHTDFYQLFALGTGKQNVRNYQRYIEHALDDDCRRFWSGGMLRQVFGKKRIHYFQRDFYAHSRSSLFIGFLHTICRIAGCSPAKVLEAQSLEEQAELFNKHLEPVFDHWIVRSLGKLPCMLYSLGIPPQQFSELGADTLSLINSYRERVRRLCCDFPIQENYFAAQALKRTYLWKREACVPDYLHKENFQTLKRHIEAVDTQLVGFTEFLTQQEDNAYNSFVLLDSQDWMTSEQLHALWFQLARVGMPHSRIIFRTAGVESPIDDSIGVDLRSKFYHHHALSSELHAKDRSAVYGGFHVYELIK